MPRLGMNQDSGTIVRWLKARGEEAAAGEALFEVETDKATVEVEAREAGFLAEIRVEAGAEAPVGATIATIVATADELAGFGVGAASSGDLREPAPTPAPEPEPSATREPAPTAPPERVSTSSPQEAEGEIRKARSALEPAASTRAAGMPEDRESAAAPVAAPSKTARPGRILASPKARRLAAERGVDLAGLRARGVAEPIHAADLDRLAASGSSAVFARADAAAFDALLAGAGGEADRAMLFAAFAAGAWRARFAADSVGVAIRGLDGGERFAANPDRGGAGEAGRDLALLDLCGTRLSGYFPPGGGAALSVAREGDSYRLVLAFDEAGIPLSDAAALLDDIAARIDDPIRQLL